MSPLPELSPSSPGDPAGDPADSPDPDWRAAQGHLDAAAAILLDGVAAPEHAAVHLLRAWRELGIATPASLQEGPPGWLPDDRIEASIHLLERLQRSDESGEQDATPSPRALVAHVRWLRGVTTSHLRYPRHQRARRRLMLSFALLLSLPLIAYGVVRHQRQAELPWLGRLLS